MDHQSVKDLIIGFEEGSWPAADWTHQSHIYMALWYLSKLPLEEATVRIKEGIKEYNLSQGGKNTATSGYHETITEFYIQILHAYITNVDFADEDRHWNSLAVQPFMDKSFPLQFYSESYLMGPTARASWCEPDLKPIRAYENTLLI